MPEDRTVTDQSTAAARRPVERLTAGSITVLGAVGLVAAFVLSVDKVEALKAAARGDSFTAICDVNAFVSCSAVVSSTQSEAFGFPNSFLGIIGFTGVVLLGVLLLLQGRMPRVLWAAFQLGLVLAAVFVTWLQAQSLYEIGKLCPYCMVVWAVVIPLVVVGTRESLEALRPGLRLAQFLRHWTVLVVLLWYVGVLSAIWFRFGSDLWA